MSKAYVNSLRDTATLDALTDAVIAALAQQAITATIPVNQDDRSIQEDHTRLLRRLVMGQQMMVEDEIPDFDGQPGP